MRLARQLGRHRLREAAAARIRQDHSRRRRAQRLDGREQGLGLQHHPAAAAELVVVGDAVLAPRVVSEIDHPDVNEPPRTRAAEDRLRDDRLHHPGK